MCKLCYLYGLTNIDKIYLVVAKLILNYFADLVLTAPHYSSRTLRKLPSSKHSWKKRKKERRSMNIEFHRAIYHISLI